MEPGDARAISRDLIVRESGDSERTVELRQGVGCLELIQQTPGAVMQSPVNDRLDEARRQLGGR